MLFWRYLSEFVGGKQCWEIESWVESSPITNRLDFNSKKNFGFNFRKSDWFSHFLAEKWWVESLFEKKWWVESFFEKKWWEMSKSSKKVIFQDIFSKNSPKSYFLPCSKPKGGIHCPECRPKLTSVTKPGHHLDPTSTINIYRMQWTRPKSNIKQTFVTLPLSRTEPFGPHHHTIVVPAPPSNIRTSHTLIASFHIVPHRQFWGPRAGNTVATTAIQERKIRRNYGHHHSRSLPDGHHRERQWNLLISKTTYFDEGAVSAVSE